MTVNPSGTLNFKVVLLGEGCVGKTSLLVRYIEDKFTERHMSTLQATFMNKRLNINGKRLNLSIWDTAGQEKFHALGPIYYRNSNGAILVYDITDEDSFAKVRNWVKELKKMLGNNLVLMIAGNKIDLERERTVDMQEAEDYAKAVGARHYFTSAKHNIGVEELFVDLARELVDRMEQGPSSEDDGRNRVIVVDDEPAPQSSCCGTFRR
ncbi:ras-related protein Rab-21 [Epargyreus clarus]|uniref:ras-related protein Rab-21 n=1 Tax=Epargyreus clarus TaxID=520877 RepID=UPI003C2BA912